MDYEILEQYIKPEISEQQYQQFKALGELYADWNSKINVISRKDIENLYAHHVLHSLAIAKFLGELVPGTTFLDLGTGGGFPGIPLAIAYPDCKFHLIDRIGKKIRVAQAVANSIGLNNVSFQHGDVGECRQKFDYVVSRAVMSLGQLIPLVKKNISKTSKNRYQNGLVCLKGDNFDEEIEKIKEPVIDYPVREFINLPFFETKKIIYVPL